MIARFTQWYQRHFSDPQVVILSLSLLLGLVAVILFARMLAPVVASLIIAYLLEGAVQRLERFGLPRLMAVISVFSAFVTALLFLLFGLLPMLTRQLAAIVQQLPSYIGQAQAWLATLPERYPQLVAPAETVSAATERAATAAEGLPAEQAERQLALISEEQLSRMLDNMGTELVNYGATLVSFSGVIGLASLLIFLVLMPVLVFFFLKDKRALLDWLRAYMPRDRALVTSVWSEVDAQIGNYVRGKVLEILIVWVVTYLVFMALGLPFAMLLSMLVGFSVIIPYIGAAVVTLPVALVALIAFGIGAEFWYVLIAYAIIQALDGNVLVPILFSEVVNLHPVAIIVAVLVFGGIWGFWGVFFAIPLATLIHAVLRAWPRKSEADDEGEAAQSGA
ncbi:AI-2E family transporter [Wenzhouxiangella marina]|uniref:Permase n=1 Tax=Wenzhouxiangella marina TaxID=1579979 RepID=A0A0K0XXI9_9GAMM|nr:AI-2E family transporter [Wenzhouxiangella marina]AKS42390.1 Permase [Wenzhouxiangella marina]MBB6085836.1 putative permease [Wenzhouxiangella marina]